MGEIKFRAWVNTTGEMVDVDAIVFNDGVKVSPYKPHILDRHNDIYLLEDVVLEQYTGLKDKNGVEIYEGDVFRYTEHIGYLVDSFSAEVCCDEENACWGYKAIRMDLGESSFRPFNMHDELQEDFLDYLKVIGNIHDNPELEVS